MTDTLNRRTFLNRSTTAIAAGALAANLNAAESDAKPQTKKRHLLKAVKIGMVKGELSLLEKFQLVKGLGYDGIELSSPNGFSRDEVIAARDQSRLPIHGVVCSVHWRDTLSDPNPEVRARGVEGLKTALEDSKAYGGTSVLLVPAKVTKEVSYADAYQRSQAEIRKALPLAEKLGIKILFENVWNGFLLSPLETARYIDEFETKMVGAYFDVGNVVNFGWPEHWIRILGKRIVKLDIKEYSRKLRDKSGPYAGFRVKLGDGDCDWPAVMQALDEIGYEGWGTAEVAGGGRERLADIAARMDRLYAM